jgi:hypothetical protein
MLIFIPIILLFFTALILLVLRSTPPAQRYSWLVAAGGALLAWLSTWFWLFQIPYTVELPSWQPAILFADAPSFLADQISWIFALSLTTLTAGIFLTTLAREGFPAHPLSWPGMFILSGLGILAIMANNSLTLVLIWAAFDLAELIAMLRSVQGVSASERVVIAFSTRAAAVLLLLWANMLTIHSGSYLSFASMSPAAGLFLILAAGLRLGVLPLHLPYTSESALRHDFGTLLRLSTAASSLVILARISPTALLTPLAPLLQILAALAAIYGSWNWLRAPDALTGRPHWLIGMAALAVSATLRAAPLAAAAWSCAMLLTGGMLFLASFRQKWFNRLLLTAVWGLSALPFSLTAIGWQTHAPAFWLTWPVLLTSQALLVAGFIRHVLRSPDRTPLEPPFTWIHFTYLFGIVVFLIPTFALGWIGWDGALQIGHIPLALFVSLLTVGLVWATPRFRIFNPPRAHWVRPASSGPNVLYRGLWNLYQFGARLSQAITLILEGESGLLWTLLFIVLFLSFTLQRTP